MQHYLKDADSTEQFGAKLYSMLPSACLVFLEGDLGAGKTTLVRGYLRAAGYEGTVKSPTYNLVEEYRLPARTVYHFDLYRMSDPEELEALGIRDYFRHDSICFIEWAERGEGFLPDPDYLITLDFTGTGRTLTLTDLLTS